MILYTLSFRWMNASSSRALNSRSGPHRGPNLNAVSCRAIGGDRIALRPDEVELQGHCRCPTNLAHWVTSGCWGPLIAAYNCW